MHCGSGQHPHRSGRCLRRTRYLCWGRGAPAPGEEGGAAAGAVGVRCVHQGALRARGADAAAPFSCPPGARGPGCRQGREAAGPAPVRPGLPQTTSLKKTGRRRPGPGGARRPAQTAGPERTQLPIFLAVGPSGPMAHVSENSSCHPVLPSDASDEQNAQSPAENSMNSAEKVERQPPGDAGPGAETSSVAQVPRSRSQRGSQSGREPAGVSGVRREVFRYFVLSCSRGTIGTSGCVLPCPAPALGRS